MAAANQSTSFANTTKVSVGTGSRSPSDIPAIVGASIGLFIGIPSLILCIYCCILKKRLRSENSRNRTPTQPPPHHAAPPKQNPARAHAVQHPKPSAPIKAPACQQKLCFSFLRSLNLNPAYFDSQYDKCFCSVCSPTSASNPVWSSAGSKYAAPLTWTRYGLRVDKTFAKSHNIFKTWHTTYYATSIEKLSSIIDNRFVPFPGDTLLSGELFDTIVPKHEYIYTSPSIRYACRQHSCPDYSLKADDVLYRIRIILQCKQNPIGVRKGKGTVAHNCGLIPDDEIEWTTEQRSSVVPFALLIKATKT